MDLSWILLAFFLVALIRGMTKALSRSMLKNSLRLGAVAVAFLITFALQVGGVFQNAIASVVEVINLAAMLPMLAGKEAIISAIASTIASPFIFVIIFFPILWILRIIIAIVCKVIEKKAKAEAEAAPTVETSPATEEAPVETSEPVAEPVAETEPASEPVAEGEATPVAEPKAEEQTEAEPETEPATETASCEEAAPEVVVPAEEPAPVAEPAPIAEVKAEKPKKAKKKSGLYEECAWKRVISVVAGGLASILVLSVFLMPTFYIFSIASTATHALDSSDADDSQIYKIADIVDEYVVAPYENSFVYKFYDHVAVIDLLNYTATAGGKITLDDGRVVYADDMLRSLISHGISAGAQITSAKSECATVKEDVVALLADPTISSLLSDVLMSFIKDYEMEEPSEEDLLGGLVANFVEYYKAADKATIEKDLQALGGAVGVLAEARIIAMLVSGNVAMEDLLADEEILGDVV